MKEKPHKTFLLGQLYATPGALGDVHSEDRLNALVRHSQGDWGECSPDDWQANEEALETGSRLFSVYRDRTGTKFWIITEADRSITTILLPSEY